MGLNIKNEEVHRLAREVAAKTGETMTHAIQTALEERLARITALRQEEIEARRKKVREILDSIPHYPGASSNHDDFYDENGLPI